ncbi:putative dtdp-glucosedehydratase [Phaeomoniella chlamydospora]|uniref:Putative dtdp-glucosedehydratase n=1 Tax=Phaeomoniella chlamydospora TaxID=158046 RepID=A0A0G2HAS9_PHACM|nr:putative dtdp-glucosedehydratase [Phaeomoniella chlamydospora]
MNGSANRYSGQVDWRRSPVFTGSTKYDSLPDVKNILITGGAGFIASWLVRHLAMNYPEYHIICFDKLDYCASLNNVKCLEGLENFDFCYGDITSGSDVQRALKKYNVDTVFHFAAQSHVDLSFGNSFQFTETNVKGTHVMLECCVKAGVKKFIHISTDEVMGEVGFDDEDLLENSVLAPTNPYSASKAAAEMYVNAYAKSFKLPVIIVRSNNVYGPHQFPEKVIPKFTCLLAAGLPLMLHGDGSNTRRYLYAGNAADAFDTILHKGKIGEIYNVDSHDEISNRDLAFKLLDHFGVSEEKQRSMIHFTQDRPFNDKRYAVNGDKLRSLGWEQRTNFEEGLKTTINWYRQYGQNWWGDIENVLTPFPTLKEGEVLADAVSVKLPSTPAIEHEANGEARILSNSGKSLKANDSWVPGPVMITA